MHAPPLYIQEKVYPKVLIDDLLRRTESDEVAADPQVYLFADFNGVPDEGAKPSSTSTTPTGPIA